jgi:hypothetical protein
MDNSETLATLGTQDTRRRQTKQRTQHRQVLTFVVSQESLQVKIKNDIFCFKEQTLSTVNYVF